MIAENDGLDAATNDELARIVWTEIMGWDSTEASAGLSTRWLCECSDFSCLGRAGTIAAIRARRKAEPTWDKT